MPDETVEERIRARAHRLWEQEGCPQGRAEAHWEQARLIAALEDSQHTMLKPIATPDAEPAELMQNLGEFPTLADQGEEETYPKPRSRILANQEDEHSVLAEPHPLLPASRESAVPVIARPAAAHSEFARMSSALFLLAIAASSFAICLSLRSWIGKEPQPDR